MTSFLWNILMQFCCTTLQATVLGMMELKEFPTFKQHVRDFLVQASPAGCVFSTWLLSWLAAGAGCGARHVSRQDKQ